MLGLHTVLVLTHIVANLVWIGSIGSVGVLVSAPGDAVARGTLALRVYKRLSTPAFGVAFLAGGTRLLLDPHFYFVTTKFMHAKLLFAIIVIALHHVIGARAKHLALGKATEAGAVPTLTPLLLLAAAASATFAWLKPF